MRRGARLGLLLLVALVSACRQVPGSPPPALTPTPTPPPVATAEAPPAATATAVATAAPVPQPTAVPTATAAPATAAPATAAPAPLYYGIAQLVDSEAGYRSAESLRAEMQAVKALGINAVLQSFHPRLTPADWQRFLDVAADEGLVVIGKIGPVAWNPTPDDLSPVLDLLAVVGDHPALYAFQILHEPWELYTTAQIQELYRAVKAAYPDVRLSVGLSGTIERYVGDPERQFADDICDVCLVNMKAFQTDNVVGESDGYSRVAAAAPIIARADPDAELWSSVQVWAPPDGGRRGFRVPTPEEMADLYCRVQADIRLQGFFWEMWTVARNEEGTLRGAALTEQRLMIGELSDGCPAGP